MEESHAWDCSYLDGQSFLKSDNSVSAASLPGDPNTPPPVKNKVTLKVKVM